MIRTEDQEQIDMAKELDDLREVIKNLTKREKELKDAFKQIIGDSNGIECGDICILLQDATTSALDKKALVADHGAEFVNKYTKVTEYQKLVIQKRRAA